MGENEWLLDGAGTVAETMRQVDWAATPLGPISRWSVSLRTTVATVLHSRHPMFLWWGPHLVQIYNDAYLPSFGVGKHPAAMGQCGRDCWPENWHIIGPQIDAVMRDGTPSWHEDALVPIYRNGSLEDAYWTYGYSPVRDDDGRIGGTLVVCTETTERVWVAHRERHARESAELASRAKDDFLSTASHELRTPLNAIVGWSRLLQSGRLTPDEFQRAVESIQRNAHVQVRLIEDLLDGSRIITGRLHLEVRALDLTAVVQAALDAVAAAADAKRITLTATLDPAAARVVGDPDRLQQVIWNLATNAIKFTPKGGSVDVSLDRAGTDIRLRVVDSGEGIAEEFLPHVFERFRQAEGATTRRHGGLGLGLALVRHLVEAHGGTVHADSPGPGLGATFTVTLPVQAVYAALLETPPAPPPPSVNAFVARPVHLHGVAILVVDDEADARDLVSTALKAHGAEVTAVASAADALALIAARGFALLVSDVGMPGTDGYQLIRRVRSLDSPQAASVPAVALTAYSRDEDRSRALAAGFQAYLSKPVEPDDLVQVASELVRDDSRRRLEDAGSGRRRPDTLVKFERILQLQGIQPALRFLNNRTAYRFTGIYRFDPPALRNLSLLDADDPDLQQGEDPPLREAYCSIVGEFQRPFSSADTMLDPRLREHPARDSVRAYCGVLLRARDGTPFGTLCHFDMVPRDVPLAEIGLMEAAAALIMRALTPEALTGSPASGLAGPPAE